MIKFRDMDMRLRAITGLVFAEIVAARYLTLTQEPVNA